MRHTQKPAQSWATTATPKPKGGGAVRYLALLSLVSAAALTFFNPNLAFAQIDECLANPEVKKKIAEMKPVIDSNVKRFCAGTTLPAGIDSLHIELMDLEPTCVDLNIQQMGCNADSGGYQEYWQKAATYYQTGRDKRFDVEAVDGAREAAETEMTRKGQDDLAPSLSKVAQVARPAPLRGEQEWMAEVIYFRTAEPPSEAIPLIGQGRFSNLGLMVNVYGGGLTGSGDAVTLYHEEAAVEVKGWVIGLDALFLPTLARGSFFAFEAGAGLNVEVAKATHRNEYAAEGVTHTRPSPGVVAQAGLSFGDVVTLFGRGVARVNNPALGLGGGLTLTLFDYVHPFVKVMHTWSDDNTRTGMLFGRNTPEQSDSARWHPTAGLGGAF